MTDVSDQLSGLSWIELENVQKTSPDSDPKRQSPACYPCHYDRNLLEPQI